MSINEKPSSRAWATADEDSPMVCYLGMEGRVTIGELIEHFAEKYPHVDPMALRLNCATVKWEEAPTPEDIASREKNRAWQAARQERWERDAYARLKEKFEAPTVGDHEQRCPGGCDCSCCYGYPDRDCHCFADPCNCGRHRNHSLAATSTSTSLNIYVSPTGRSVRVFRDGDEYSKSG